MNGYCSCNDDWGDAHCSTPTPAECKHGNYTYGTCVCDNGWRTAGFTNTLEWVTGSCTQYKCQSSEMCQELTGLSEASCPISNWNCYCGFSHLGFQTKQVGCMRFWYALSVAGFRFYKNACLLWIWKIAGIAALISLPFGTHRIRCDHHRSKIARFKKWRNGYSSTCQGECVTEKKWKIRNDLSLALYWLQTGLWWYVFLSFSVIFIIFIWSIILWILFIMAIIAAVCVAACGENNNNHFSDMTCCICCDNGTELHTRNGKNTNIVYIGGPLPGDTPCGCGDGCCEGCSGCGKSWLYPFKWLIHSYPVFPENLQGGVIGYLIGTHITVNAKRRLRNRNTCITRFLSLDWCKRKVDLRENTNWQTIIQTHVRNTNRSSSPPTRIHMNRPVSPSVLSRVTTPISRIANRLSFQVHQRGISETETEQIWKRTF